MIRAGGNWAAPCHVGMEIWCNQEIILWTGIRSKWIWMPRLAWRTSQSRSGRKVRRSAYQGSTQSRVLHGSQPHSHFRGDGCVLREGLSPSKVTCLRTVKAALRHGHRTNCLPSLKNHGGFESRGAATLEGHRADRHADSFFREKRTGLVVAPNTTVHAGRGDSNPPGLGVGW